MSERTPDSPDDETDHDTPDELAASERSATTNRIEKGDAEDKDSVFGVPFPFDLGSSGNVGIREGISYGLGLVVYIVGLLLITSILTAVGSAFVAGGIAVDNFVITFLLGLFGFVVSLISLVLFFAGFAGLLYKIIADGVSRGSDIA